MLSLTLASPAWTDERIVGRSLDGDYELDKTTFAEQLGCTCALIASDSTLAAHDYQLPCYVVR